MNTPDFFLHKCYFLPRTRWMRSYRQNGFVAVLEILTACSVAGLRMTQGVRLLHAAVRLHLIHHFVVPLPPLGKAWFVRT